MSHLPPSLFLALRYLRPRRSFVSAITIISVLGVMLGVTVLILVISVFTGFHHQLHQKVLGFNPHLTVTADTLIPHWKEVVPLLEKRPHVRGVAPYVAGPVLVKSNGRVFPLFVKGLDPFSEAKVNNLAQYVRKGKFDLDGEKIVIGIELARQHGIFVGDKITIYTPKNFENKKVAYLPLEPTVTGIFETGMFDYDFNFALCSLETAQELYDIGNKIHGIAVMTDSLENVTAVQQDFFKILEPRHLHARTWIEQNQGLFEVVAVEKNIMFFLLIFITIVAAFSIMSTLIVVTVQKTREIGILKSLGATPQNILTIFLAQGIFVGTIGIGCGLGLGMTLLHYRNEILDFLREYTGYQLFPRQFYHFNQLPAETSPQDLLLICGSAFLICTLAGLIPAWRAARLEPARALRDF